MNESEINQAGDNGCYFLTFSQFLIKMKIDLLQTLSTAQMITLAPFYRFTRIAINFCG